MNIGRIYNPPKLESQGRAANSFPPRQRSIQRYCRQLGNRRGTRDREDVERVEECAFDFPLENCR